MTLSDLRDMLVPTHSLAELVLRGTIMYLGIFVLLRLILKRRAHGISTPDVLLLVLVADAAQNGMTNEYRSVTEGLVLVATILGWDLALDWLSYRFPAFERIVRPVPLPLIENGRINRRNMREEFVTLEELLTMLREHGIERIESVDSAVLEPTGELTVRGHPTGTSK